MTLLYQLEERWLHRAAAFDLVDDRRVFTAGDSPAYIQFLPFQRTNVPEFLKAMAPRGYALAYKMENRNAVVMAREPYRTIMAIARWWEWHRWCLEELAIRIGLYRLSEGGYYNDARFDPPDLWGTPIWKHERHLQ